MTATDPGIFTTSSVLNVVVDAPGVTTGGPRSGRTGAAPLLRRLLVFLDASAVATGWGLGLLVTGGLSTDAGSLAAAQFVAFVVLMTALTIAAVAAQRLYLSRVCTIRAVEISRLWRACAIAGVASLLTPRALPLELSISGTLVSTAIAFGLLVVCRGGYRYWLQVGRRDGRFLRPVVLVGANEEGYDLIKLTRDHPEIGFRVVAVVGDRMSDDEFEPPHLGPAEDTLAVMRATGANGALVAASAVPPRQMNELVRDLIRNGFHVHLSSGLRGVDHRRLRAQPMAYEPLFYLEPLRLQPRQVALKRAIDVVGALVGGVLFAVPVLLLAALAIKIEDRGPVFYRQSRVGRHGRPFHILKLRTMIPNADRLYDQLAPALAGRDGPLVKLANDPRRTKVGRFLERMSVDELPQLWNVLKGEMSLVGPRPAQAREVAEFDEALLARLDVRPGISGLWQVEARDNPSFAAYRRYDLFYLENWSVSLDLAILVATFQRVLFRGIELIVSRKPEMAGSRVVTLQAD